MVGCDDVFAIRASLRVFYPLLDAAREFGGGTGRLDGRLWCDADWDRDFLVRCVSFPES
jgi:hypothetical protein